MGHKQKNKVRSGEKRSPKLEPWAHFREGESGSSRGPNFSRGSEASLPPTWTVRAQRPWGHPARASQFQAAPPQTVR